MYSYDCYQSCWSSLWPFSDRFDTRKTVMGKEKKKHFKVCETTVAGDVVSEWRWSGTEAGTAALDPHE